MKKFFSFFNANNSSMLTYLKSESYYEVVLQEYFNIENYIKISRDALVRESVQTELDIQPELLGYDNKAIIQRKGTPNHILKKKDITIFIYKWKFNKINVRCKVHFYRNQSFLVNYDYRSMQQKDKSYITDAIAKKYLNIENAGNSLFENTIVDKEENIIFVNEVLKNLNITYLSNLRSEWYKDMSYQTDSCKEKQEVRFERAERQFLATI